MGRWHETHTSARHQAHVAPSLCIDVKWTLIGRNVCMRFDIAVRVIGIIGRTTGHATTPSSLASTWIFNRNFASSGPVGHVLPDGELCETHTLCVRLPQPSRVCCGIRFSLRTSCGHCPISGRCWTEQYRNHSPLCLLRAHWSKSIHCLIDRVYLSSRIILLSVFCCGKAPKNERKKIMQT